MRKIKTKLQDNKVKNFNDNNKSTKKSKAKSNDGGYIWVG